MFGHTRDVGTPQPSSSNRSRFVIAAALIVAFGALITAAAFSGERTPSAPVLSGSAADGGGERDGEDIGTPLDVNPIEAWLPQSGIGSTCTEAVGVDLIPGYSAILTINGVEIAEEDTNVYLDFEARELSAGGSQGQVTWGPEEDCPNGLILRPQGNTVEACIYRVDEGPASCRVGASFTFDAL